jgi:phage repressor protein C with HTH and peptisase S24 domain
MIDAAQRAHRRLPAMESHAAAAAAAVMGAMRFMTQSLHNVAINVNTACSDCVATLGGVNKEERLRRDQGRRLTEARQAAGYRSARAAAMENGWPESSYRAHESGTRTIGQDDAERYARRFHLRGAQVTAQDILFGAADEPVHEAEPNPHQVPVMGYVGAGAVVEPDFEQVPEDGLDAIDLPFVVEDGIIAFRVRGESMRPSYRDGDAILVWREQRMATDSYIGEEAVVRTGDGRRFLKEIQGAGKRGIYNLYSHNDRMIENVRLEWVGEIHLIIRARQIGRLGVGQRNAARKKRPGERAA